MLFFVVVFKRQPDLILVGKEHDIQDLRCACFVCVQIIIMESSISIVGGLGS